MIYHTVLIQAHGKMTYCMEIHRIAVCSGDLWTATTESESRDDRYWLGNNYTETTCNPLRHPLRHY